MAKRKPKKVAVKKSKTVSVNKSKMSVYGWFFINLLLVAILVYGIYRLWNNDWAEGLSIIVFDLLVILVIKLVMKLKRR